MEGSTVFDVSNSGELAVFDEQSLSVKYNHRIFLLNEQVYKIIIFKNRPLFISRQKIFTTSATGLITVFETTTGRVFDAAVFNDELYISIKKEMQHEFEFTAYKSSELGSLFLLIKTALNLLTNLTIKIEESLPRKDLISFPVKR